MTGEGSTTFQYDAVGRMKSVNNGTTETNGFDGDSQRVKKVESGVTVFSVRSSVMKQTGFEVGGNGALYRANVYAGSQKLIGQLSPDGQFYWRHENHLGSGYKLTNSAGTVVYRAEHDPHGNVLLETGTTTLTAHKFTSYERDNSTGLDYANARMFSGTRARFTKPDPAGLSSADARPQSLNRYSYASNDPVNRVDRTGLDDEDWNNLIWYIAFGTFLGDLSYDMTTIGYIGGGDVSLSFWSWQDPPRPAPIVLPTPNHPDIPLYIPPQIPYGFPSEFKAAFELALQALLKNDCRAIFKGGIDPAALLVDLINKGQIRFADLGNINANAQTTPAFGYETRTGQDGNTITVNTGVSGLDAITFNTNASSNFQSGYLARFGVDDLTNRAITIIHELGHAANIIYNRSFSPEPNSGSNILFDSAGNPISQAISLGNSSQVKNACFGPQ
jgi:RHS repeat-associated protein